MAITAEAERAEEPDVEATKEKIDCDTLRKECGLETVELKRGRGFEEAGETGLRILMEGGRVE